MRYLTKEWYQTMQNTGLGVMLRVDSRAERYSEEVFRLLREEKLLEWLEDRRELCPFLGEVFDEEAECRLFEEGFRRELEKYRTQIPPRILQKVADIRVLALGYCSESVFRELEEFRQKCQEWTHRTLEEAWNARKAEGLDQVWNGEYSLHDSYILSFRREGECLLIDFEREDPQERLRNIREEAPELLEEHSQEDYLWPEVKAVRFHDGCVLKQERDPQNAWWLYDEIWQTEEGFEIHALLWREEVFELTIRCREPEMVWTVPPRLPE